MRTVVFIGTNKSGSSREAIRAADKLGYFTVLFTDKEKHLEQREEFPDVHEMVFKSNLLDSESILEEIGFLQLQGKDVKACISLIDPYVYYSTMLSEQLGLAHLSSKALYKMEDKLRFREELQNHPATPYFLIFNHQESIKLWSKKYAKHLPLIVKSPVSNGSKDVLLVESIGQLKKALGYLKKKYPEHPVLVEEYLLGEQFLAEVFVYKGNISIIGTMNQEITKKDRFIVTGYSLPAQFEGDDYQSFHDTIVSIVQELGLENGTCHLEIRKTSSGWKLIEINPRMSGGAMNSIIRESTGINLAKETVRLFLGEEPDLIRKINKAVYAHFITVSSKGRLTKVTGKNRAKAYDGVKEVYVKPRKGTILVPAKSMGNRYAYVLASADFPEEARNIARTAASEIQFHLESLKLP